MLSAVTKNSIHPDNEHNRLASKTIKQIQGLSNTKHNQIKDKTMNKSKCLLMRLALIIGFIAQCALLQASTLIDGLYYDLDMSMRTATVTYGTDNYASLPANVKIPESVEYNGVTYSVTKVANYAFSNCKSLESISIPSTVLQIGDATAIDDNMPFYGCSSLKNVRFEDGENGLVFGSHYYQYYKYDKVNKTDTYVTSYGGLFDGCPLEEVYIGRNISYAKNGSYIFEESPVKYGYSAFYGKTKLTKVTISPAVTKIPAYLFYKCSALNNVSIQGQLVEIPMYSFSECI